MLGSSVVERRAVNADVAGSNPALAANKKTASGGFYNSAIVSDIQRSVWFCFKTIRTMVAESDCLYSPFSTR